MIFKDETEDLDDTEDSDDDQEDDPESDLYQKKNDLKVIIPNPRSHDINKNLVVEILRQPTSLMQNGIMLKNYPY